MKKIFGLIVCLALMIGAPALSANFDRGWNAFESGDYKTALREFRELARHRDLSAQWYLGVMYADGLGVPQDYVRAYMWADIGDSNGYVASQILKQTIAGQLTSEQIEKAKKLAKECIEKSYHEC